MGFRGVGKSSITHQYVDNHFVEGYNPTIENAFHKTIKYKGDDFQTEIVDTAGHDEYSIFSQQHAIGVHGYLLVYSISHKNSLELIKILNDKILNACGTDNIPRVLVGNKADLIQERKILTDDVKQLANEWGVPFIECSAKHNENISEAFRLLVGEIEKDNYPEPAPKESSCILM